MVKYGKIKPSKKLKTLWEIYRYEKERQIMEQNIKNIKILLADESSEFRKLCRQRLSDLGYTSFEESTNGEDTLYKISRFHPDIVLLDIWLSKPDFIGVIKGAFSFNYSPDKPPSFIVTSAINNQNMFHKLLPLTNFQFLTKSTPKVPGPQLPEILSA